MLFESSDPAVLEIPDELGDEAFARDIGTADLTVIFSDPRLPAADVTASLQGINIAEELFYGSSTATSGIFGDTVELSSSVVHTFTDSTLVQFGDGTAGFVDSVGVDGLRFIVGAGYGVTAPITLQNLEHVSRGDTDGILTNFDFAMMDSVPDAFEPNGTACLDADVCNGDEACQTGSCTLGPPLDCDDGDACTADSCDGVTGCGHDPIEFCGPAVPALSGPSPFMDLLWRSFSPWLRFRPYFTASPAMLWPMPTWISFPFIRRC